MANHARKNDHAVQVASIQTLMNRDKPDADLIIIDEAHLSCSASYKSIVKHYADIVQVVPMATLIASGHLVKPRVFAPFTPDMRGVKKSKGDYDATQTAALMDKKEITADIVKQWVTSALDRKTIVFASSVAHSKNIVAEFLAANISAKHLDANTPAKERDQTLAEWRDGQFTVLSNMGLFIEGLDVPAASCCILARPTKSLTIYLQAVGRVMRPHESKSDCVILDCAGLTYEHGFVDDAREWTLDGKAKKPREEMSVVHICEECAAAYSKAQHPDECPECGAITPVETKEVG